MSDPADMTAPRDPAIYRAQTGVSPAFVAAIAVACALGGAGLAVVGGRMFGAGAAPSTPVASSSESDAPTPAATAIPPALDVSPPSPALSDYSDLSARLARLESHDRVTAQAAAQALAAASLIEAAQTSRPFATELAAMRLLVPPSPELASLARLADVGAPSRTALAASFPDVAARAAAALHTPGADAGLAERIGHAVSKIITLRRTGPVTGASPDAQLARIEQRVAEGDLDHALQAIDQLPGGARQAIAPWRERAERRAEIDRAAAALRVQALQAMSAAAQDGA